jgi:hypothetical protein
MEPVTFRQMEPAVDAPATGTVQVERGQSVS